MRTRMRILFLSGREASYPRNRNLVHLLQSMHSVDVIQERLPTHSIISRTIQESILSLPALRSGKYDLICIGFYGHLILNLLRNFIHAPVLFDVFVSTFDTLSEDRKVFRPKSLLGKLALQLDKRSCSLADLILLDTHTHARYFHEMIGVPDHKLQVLPVGCDEKVFFPLPDQQMDSTLVLHYGTFLPLHGTDQIIQAAGLLKDQASVRFKVIGSGEEEHKVRALANKLNLTNVEFAPPCPLEDLPAEISKASICLGGHFGSSQKAARVIAGKTYQCIAMGKAVIVGDNPANRELLTHQVDGWFCEMNNPEALAEAILFLSRNPAVRDHLGENARKTYLRKASTAVLGKKLNDYLEQLVKVKKPVPA